MLKQINPKDLVKGKKYLVEFEYLETKIDRECPLLFVDIKGYSSALPINQPIYTLDDQPQHHDPELEMLVNVASRIYTDPIFDDGFDEAAKCAADLIAACKRIKEGER